MFHVSRIGTESTQLGSAKLPFHSTAAKHDSAHTPGPRFLLARHLSVHFAVCAVAAAHPKGPSALQWLRTSLRTSALGSLPNAQDALPGPTVFRRSVKSAIYQRIHFGRANSPIGAPRGGATDSGFCGTYVHLFSECNVQCTKEKWFFGYFMVGMLYSISLAHCW